MHAAAAQNVRTSCTSVSIGCSHADRDRKPRFRVHQFGLAHTPPPPSPYLIERSPVRVRSHTHTPTQRHRTLIAGDPFDTVMGKYYYILKQTPADRLIEVKLTGTHHAHRERELMTSMRCGHRIACLAHHRSSQNCV